MEPDVINKLFDQFNTPESHTILVIMLIAFLFGLLVGILSRGRRVRQLQRLVEKYEKQLKELEAQAIALKAKTDALEENLALKAQELQDLMAERDEARAKAQMLEDEKARLYSDIGGINTELEKLEVSNQSYLSAIENLENQIIGLKARNEQLAKQLEAPQSGPALLSGHEIFPSEEPPAAYGEGLLAGARLEAVERKLQHLEDENIILKKELGELKERALVFGGQTETRSIPHIGGVEERVPEPELELDLMPEEPALPLQDEEITRDDLTLVKGIGPGIETLLKKAGINNWADLAAMTPYRLRLILDEAGEQYRIHDPSTWPAQAQLAVNGRWDLLREYQDQLKGEG